MYSVTVENQSRLGIDYLVTTYFKDGKVVRCSYEIVEGINKQKQINELMLLKSLAEQKLNLLQKI